MQVCIRQYVKHVVIDVQLVQQIVPIVVLVLEVQPEMLLRLVLVKMDILIMKLMLLVQAVITVA